MRFFKFSAVITIFALILGLNPVLAMKTLVTAELETPGTDRILHLPAEAGNAHVISLGTAVDPQSGKVVEGYAFIHGEKTGKKTFAKPPWAGGGKDKGGSNSCFAVLAKDARWKVNEDYLVDGSNNAGLSAVEVGNLIATGLNTWDSQVAYDIFGSEVAGVVDGADEVAPDGKNEVLFADVSTPGAIAVTITWGIFNGPPSGRELLEWDQVYDDADFTWSTNGAAGDMDFLNITVHEIGHALGLGHPEDTCTDESMYRFAAEGETKKQDLESGDVAGVEKLYN